MILKRLVKAWEKASKQGMSKAGPVTEDPRQATPQPQGFGFSQGRSGAYGAYVGH